MFKIVYETTQDFANVMTCFAVPGASGAPVTPQGVLPDISMYKVRIIVTVCLVDHCIGKWRNRLCDLISLHAVCS